MIDYESKVKEVYPEAFLLQKYNERCADLPIGVYVCRLRRLFGFTIPLFPIKIGYGWVERKAWQSAYIGLVSQGLITPQITE